MNGNTLSVTNTPGAIINWQQFSIGKDEITRFIQQHAGSSVLNRVTSQNPSTILGQLLSNGRVFLINPSGIAFGQGALIDVAGFAASTLNISDADFISGRMRFVAIGDAGKLTNAGTIRTAEGGHVYLIAPNVENQASGIITSPKGEVVIAAGKTVELVNARTPDIRVELTAPDNQAVNAGQIIASSGRVGVFGTLIKNSGLVSASRAEVGEGGKVVFRAVKDVTLDATSWIEASGAKGGEVKIQGETGTLLAQGIVEAKGDEAKGGEIQLLANRVGLIGNARVDASGESQGGTVLLGGDFQGKNPDVQNADRTYIGVDARISADALGFGKGGKVVIWANEATYFYGDLSVRGGRSGGDGGFAEVSGKEVLVFRGAAHGGAQPGYKGGTLLLDPQDIILSNGPATQTAVDNGTGIDVAFNALPDENTNLTLDVDAGASFDGFNQVTLQANRDIKLQANWDVRTSIGVTGADASVTLAAGQDIIIGDGGVFNLVTGKVGANEGNISLLAGQNVVLNGDVVTDNVGTITIRADATTTQLGFTPNGAQTGFAGNGTGAITRTAGSI